MAVALGQLFPTTPSTSIFCHGVPIQWREGDASASPLNKTRGEGWPGTCQVEHWGDGWLWSLLRLRTQRASGSIQLPLDLWGELCGGRGLTKSSPRGPSLGDSVASFSCGAQQAGWPRVQDLTGWGRAGEEAHPVGAPGEDLEWHRSLQLGVSPGRWESRPHCPCAVSMRTKKSV